MNDKFTDNPNDSKENNSGFRIIVTGGSGFIGTNLVQHYVDQGHQVLNIDYAKPKRDDHFKYWANIDLRELELLRKEVEIFDPQYVIHLAARTDLRGKSLEDYSSNTIGTENLIKSLDTCKSIERVLFTSSMLVCRLGYVPSTPTDYSPSTFYGESKMLMEKFIRSSEVNYKWSIIRPTSIWGPWFGEPYRDFFNMVIKRTYFHIGSTVCKKTYGYVKNAIFQIDALIRAEINLIDRKVFYLGDYSPVIISEWANEIAGKVNYQIRTVPYFIIKIAAIVGDVLNRIGINFPMTTFRLSNMLTDNIIDLESTKNIAPDLPTSRINGVEETLMWISSEQSVDR
jgi:GlcNAc-P-P-Und epimerase